MASFVYNYAKRYLLDRGTGTIDLSSANYFVGLWTTNYTPDYDHANMTSLTDSELGVSPACAGYTPGFAGAGRVTIPGTKAWAIDNTGDKAAFDASGAGSDILWTAVGTGYGAGPAIQYIITFLKGASEALSFPVSCHELTPTVTPNGGNLTLAWNTSGIINITN